MIVLVAVGAMNIPAMVALSGVILIEKVWRHGRAFSCGRRIPARRRGACAVHPVTAARAHSRADVADVTRHKPPQSQLPT